MSETRRPGTDSGILKAVAAAPRAATKGVRVRLMVAVPAVIVLLLSLLAWILFWMTDAYISPARQMHQDSQQDFARDWLKILWLFVVGGGIIGYVLAWSLTRPIFDIIRLSERVASGDLTTKATVTGLDEMGQLGSSFNHMLESLNNFIDTRNRFILESFTGGLIVTDLNGSITAVNSAAENLLGLRNHDVSGKSIREVLANPDMEELLRLHERVIWKQETVVDKKLDIRVKGKLVPVIVGFTPMRDSSQNVFGVIINVRDRAEMEKFYQHLRNADRLATMGTFASGLAHEIRNPLGSIKGTAQLLQEDLGSNEQAGEYLQIIIKEVNRLDALVREVQAYSQPAAEKAPVDVGGLVSEIVQMAQRDERFRHRAEPVEVQVSQPVNVFASKHQLRQALLNIVLNAFESAGENGRVRVHAGISTVANPLVRISIANEGAAIDPCVQNRIFEPFYTTKASGTGLGLSIAAQVAMNHGGRLAVECRDGWVDFLMLLPIASPDAVTRDENGV